MVVDIKSAPDGLQREPVKRDTLEVPPPEPGSGIHHFTVALRLLVVAVFIFAVAYPALVTLVGQILWPISVQGTIVELDGEPVGSALIGQEFTSDVFFHPRPSSTGYNAMDSGSANLGPLNPILTARVREDLEELEERGIDPASVPVEWVTESGSALDPHITPEAARLQIARLSRATGLSPETLEALIETHTEGRFLGIFGWERVNVLLLNIDIQQRLGESQ